MGKLIEEIRREKKAEQKRQKNMENEKGIEELLIELRKKEGLSII